ncbi:Serine/threonine-protein kinase PknD [Microbacterium sp. MM2322]
MARFQREIAIGASMAHPNVISILDSGVDVDVPWYVMPLASGGSLLNSVPTGGVAAAELLALLEPVASALTYLHANGVLHRDLSPNNVLKVGETWVVSDFGLSVSSSLPTSYQTSMGVGGYGSPAFVSPEQRIDLRSATQQSDIYSLGKLVQFLSEGTWPDFPPDPRGPLTSVVNRSTRREPLERFRTVEDLMAGVRVVATSPPPSGSIADRIDSLIESAGKSAHVRGPEMIDLLAMLDPTDEWENSGTERLLSAVRRDHWHAAWRADPDRTLLAVNNACSVAYDEAEFRKLDGLRAGLMSADEAINAPDVRDPVVGTLAHVGASNDQWSYRRSLVELLERRTPASLIPATISGLRRAGGEAVRWILLDTRVERFPQPLRGWLIDIMGGR